MNNLDFDLLTLAAVAKVLHCSKAHVCNVLAGQVHGCPTLPAVRLGRRMLVRRETLVAWIKQNEGANGTLSLSPERGRKRA